MVTGELEKAYLSQEIKIQNTNFLKKLANNHGSLLKNISTVSRTCPPKYGVFSVETLSLLQYLLHLLSQQIPSGTAVDIFTYSIKFRHALLKKKLANKRKLVEIHHYSFGYLSSQYNIFSAETLTL